MHSTTITIRVSARKLAEFESRLGGRRFTRVWRRDDLAHVWFFRSGLVKLRTSGFTSQQSAPHFRGRFTADGDGTLTGTIRESLLSLVWVGVFAVPAAVALVFGLGSLLAEGFGWVPGYILLAVAALLIRLALRWNRDRHSDFERDARLVEDRVKRLFGR